VQAKIVKTEQNENPRNRISIDMLFDPATLASRDRIPIKVEYVFYDKSGKIIGRSENTI